jgi:hypothetical protein
MKQCVNCNIDKTVKWYSGPLCRQCYRKHLYKNEEQRQKSNLKSKKWRDDNKEYAAEKHKEWKEKNREKYLSYLKEWRSKNKEKIYLEKKQYHADNYSNNIEYKLSRTIRARIKQAIKNNYKTGSTIQLLGSSIEEFKNYLRSKFQPGMNWENYGLHGWHIDHIKPLANFNLSDPEQLKQACHYSNLQPLWAKDNLKKGSK